jgi:hypothetical protein
VRKIGVKRWQAVKQGQTVRFRTTLKSGTIIPAVALLQGRGANAGTDRVVVSTDNGELTGIVGRWAAIPCWKWSSMTSSQRMWLQP